MTIRRREDVVTIALAIALIVVAAWAVVSSVGARSRTADGSRAVAPLWCEDCAVAR